MSRFRSAVGFARRPLRVPGWVLGLFAMSAVLGNAAQWQERGDLKEAALTTKSEADCRSGIASYVEGLALEMDLYKAIALLDKVGAAGVPVPFDDAVARTFAAAVRLETAKEFRANAVQICAADPSFSTSQITAAEKKAG